MMAGGKDTDVDNLAKLVLDCLQKSVLYMGDDSKVMPLSATKLYSMLDDNRYTIVTVEQIE